MKPIFSLLIPTRHRVPKLEIFLQTIAKNTKHYDAIEVLIMHDEDDIISEAYLFRCKKRFGFQIRVFKTQQSEFLNRDYYNILASRAVGEFRWLVGDDLIIIKKDWDVFLVEKINEYFFTHKSRIIYIRIKDDTPKPEDHLPDYANFPMMSKEAIKTVGFFMPPEIPSWSGDYLVYLIYNHNKSNRILTIEEPILNHICSLTRVEPDIITIETNTTSRMRSIHAKYKIGELVPIWIAETLPHYRGKLKHFLDTYKRKINEPIQFF